MDDLMDDLIRRFYEGLKRKDPASIASCYHARAEFSDPVFELRGKRIAAMWHMLLEAGKDMEVTYQDVRVNSREGSGTGTGTGHWEAVYTFSPTGRRVHNRMDSAFLFQEGRIIGHRDRFAFWRWSRMALGLPGLLFGWTPMLRARVRKRAMADLGKFLARHPQYQ